jgi:hypothetical protein
MLIPLSQHVVGKDMPMHSMLPPAALAGVEISPF